MSDCSQISNTTFLFDAIGDGRPAADNNMLRALIHIDLSGCARIDDEGKLYIPPTLSPPGLIS